MRDQIGRVGLRLAGAWLWLCGMAWPALAQGQSPPSAPTTQPVSLSPADANEERWFRNIRQITNESMGLSRAGEAYFSPDGKRICFQAVPIGKTDYQIYVMNVDGTGLTRVSTGEGATTCAYFHPSGEKLIFASNHLDQRAPEPPPEVKAELGRASQSRYVWPFYPGMDIFEYTFSTGELSRLTSSEGYDAECSYSPDGKQIVFSSYRDQDQEIYICDADGRNAKRITNVKGYDGGPFFSPDGKRIVYRSDRFGPDSGTMQIFTNNLRGDDERPLTDHELLHWCPYWHPSGKWLIFTRADHKGRPNYDLYLLPAAGGDAIRVTTEAGADVLPAFSSDGRWMMWTARRGGLAGAQVFIAEFVGLKADGALVGAEPAKP